MTEVQYAPNLPAQPTGQGPPLPFRLPSISVPQVQPRHGPAPSSRPIHQLPPIHTSPAYYPRRVDQALSPTSPTQREGYYSPHTQPPTHHAAFQPSPQSQRPPQVPFSTVKHDFINSSPQYTPIVSPHSSHEPRFIHTSPTPRDYRPQRSRQNTRDSQYVPIVEYGATQSYESSHRPSDHSAHYPSAYIYHPPAALTQLAYPHAPLPSNADSLMRRRSTLTTLPLQRPKTEFNESMCNFDLRVRQQPVAARACGFGERDRRVIDPPPILELQVTDKVTGESVNDEEQCGFYVAHCALWSADGTTEETSLIQEQRRPTRRLMGQLVASPSMAKDELDREGCFFCFPDLSCRTNGNYRLRFVLMRINPANLVIGGTFPVLAEVQTNAFTVYAAKDFPGMQCSSALTRALKLQGCNIQVKKGNDKAMARKRLPTNPHTDDSEDGNKERDHGSKRPRYAMGPSTFA